MDLLKVIHERCNVYVSVRAVFRACEQALLARGFLPDDDGDWMLEPQPR